MLQCETRSTRAGDLCSQSDNSAPKRCQRRGVSGPVRGPGRASSDSGRVLGTCKTCDLDVMEEYRVSHSQPALNLHQTIIIMSSFPDYYQLLNISKTASQDEVRPAYKKESLRSVFATYSIPIAPLTVILTRTHPDRLVNASPAEKKIATEKFQVRIQSCSAIFRSIEHVCM